MTGPARPGPFDLEDLTEVGGWAGLDVLRAYYLEAVPNATDDQLESGVNVGFQLDRALSGRTLAEQAGAVVSLPFLEQRAVLAGGVGPGMARLTRVYPGAPVELVASVVTAAGGQGGNAADARRVLRDLKGASLAAAARLASEDSAGFEAYRAELEDAARGMDLGKAKRAELAALLRLVQAPLPAGVDSWGKPKKAALLDALEEHLETRINPTIAEEMTPSERRRWQRARTIKEARAIVEAVAARAQARDRDRRRPAPSDVAQIALPGFSNPAPSVPAAMSGAPPVPFASLTGTRSTAAALAQAGWGALITPDTYRPGRVSAAIEAGAPIAIDNGAWSVYQRGGDWVSDMAKTFCALVEGYGKRAAFVVAPDIVAGGGASLDLSRRYLPWLLERARVVLVPVQDGMDPGDVAELLDQYPGAGLFVGGSTEWKWRTAPEWVALGARFGVPVHLARVNSQRAIRAAGAMGASSYDGTSAVQFPSSLDRLQRERAQLPLLAAQEEIPCCATPEPREDPTTGGVDCVSCGETVRPALAGDYPGGPRRWS